MIFKGSIAICSGKHQKLTTSVKPGIIEQRNGLETCVGVESNQVEILIMSRNKNVATASGTTRKKIVVFSFSSTVVGLMACVIFYVC